MQSMIKTVGLRTLITDTCSNAENKARNKIIKKQSLILDF